MRTLLALSCRSRVSCRTPGLVQPLYLQPVRARRNQTLRLIQRRAGYVCDTSCRRPARYPFTQPILPMANKRSFSSTGLLPWFGIAVVVILLDQLTKIATLRMLAYGESVFVTSFFNLVHVYNKGAAFSFLASETGWQRYFFTLLGLAAAAFIIYLLKKHAG